MYLDKKLCDKLQPLLCVSKILEEKIFDSVYRDRTFHSISILSSIELCLVRNSKALLPEQIIALSGNCARVILQAKTVVTDVEQESKCIQ